MTGAGASAGARGIPQKRMLVPHLRRDLLGTLAVLAAIAAALPLGPTIVLSLLVVACLTGLLGKAGIRHGHTVAFLLVAGYLARAIVAFGYELAGLLPYRWDDYSVPAKLILENLRHGLPLMSGVEASVQTKSYALFRALINLLVGEERIFVMLVNAFLACLGCLRVAELSLRIGFSRRAMEGTLAILVLLPSGLVFTSLDMRDPLIFFLSWDALLRLLRLRESRRTGYQLALLTLELAALGFLRHYSLLIFAATATGFAMFWFLGKRSWFSLIGAVAGIALAVWAVTRPLRPLGNQLLAYADAEVRYRATGGSSYVVNLGYASWGEVFRFLPERVVHFTYGPFLWSARGSFLLLAALESSLILLFTAPALVSMRVWKRVTRNSGLLLVVLFSIAGLAAMAVVDSNYGTAIRHRFLFLPGLVLLGFLWLENEMQEESMFPVGSS